ncbi:MAG: lysozyme inhibitor LprI family protein [Hyphomicrobiales bacterium]
MRSLVLLTLLLLPVSARAGTDVIATCYQACEASTSSNPEYKACLARAADAADHKLNDAYKQLQGAIRAGAKAMGQRPDIQLSGLTSAQKKWIAYRDANCTFEDELAFGGTSIGGNYSACLCALSYERIDDFARMRARLLFE